MLSHEDLQKLSGMKHISYKNSEQDQAWKFMLRAADELLSENAQLKNQIATMREENGKASVTNPGERKNTDW